MIFWFAYKHTSEIKKALALAFVALALDVAAMAQQTQRFAEGTHTARLILDVLSKAHVSGAFEYEGRCGPGVLVPDFPPIRGHQKFNARDPVDTLRSMFSIGGQILISKEANGIIRVVGSGVQTDILGVRINHLSFNKVSDPEEALNAVLSAPEVESFILTHGIGQPFNVHVLPPYLWSGNKSPGIRSISGELKGVTLAEALDYILSKFPGFWLYQNCESLGGQRVVHFGFFPIPGRVWMWEDGQTFVK